LTLFDPYLDPFDGDSRQIDPQMDPFRTPFDPI
jgi:hypothetical protein